MSVRVGRDLIFTTELQTVYYLLLNNSRTRAGLFLKYNTNAMETLYCGAITSVVCDRRILLLCQLVMARFVLLTINGHVLRTSRRHSFFTTGIMFMVLFIYYYCKILSCQLRVTVT